MARANLRIDESVAEAFLAAQESHTVRLITIKIVDESLVFHSSADKLATAEEDFNSILPSTFQTTEALFGLFNATDGEGAQSSREDLKKTLGLGYFKADYAANELGDLSWKGYLESVDKEFKVDHLTETERLILEEKALSASESSHTKSSALNVVPFAVSSAADEQLLAFKEDNINWLELTVTSEVIEVTSARVVGVEGGFAQFLSEDVACFVAAKLRKADASIVSFFIFFCPENTPVRTKMTMSSCKASVLAAAAERGVCFDKMLEVRDLDEVNDAIAQELTPADVADTSASSLSASITHSKPTRPGKGKARVAKFQA